MENSPKHLCIDIHRGRPHVCQVHYKKKYAAMKLDTNAPDEENIVSFSWCMLWFGEALVS